MSTTVNIHDGLAALERMLAAQRSYQLAEFAKGASDYVRHLEARIQALEDAIKSNDTDENQGDTEGQK